MCTRTRGSSRVLRHAVRFQLRLLRAAVGARARKSRTLKLAGVRPWHHALRHAESRWITVCPCPSLLMARRRSLPARASVCTRLNHDTCNCTHVQLRAIAWCCARVGRICARRRVRSLPSGGSSCARSRARSRPCRRAGRASCKAFAARWPRSKSCNLAAFGTSVVARMHVHAAPAALAGHGVHARTRRAIRRHGYEFTSAHTEAPMAISWHALRARRLHMSVLERFEFGVDVCLHAFLHAGRARARATFAMNVLTIDRTPVSALFCRWLHCACMRALRRTRGSRRTAQVSTEFARLFHVLVPSKEARLAAHPDGALDATVMTPTATAMARTMTVRAAPRHHWYVHVRAISSSSADAAALRACSWHRRRDAA